MYLEKLENIPLLSQHSFHSQVATKVEKGLRLMALWGIPQKEEGGLRLFAALTDDRGSIEVLSSLVHREFLSLSPDCPQAQLFEREIYENYGVKPLEHPWLKPVRFPHQSSLIGEIDFFKVQGEEVHEVGVGPVHAGVIEPGHFRFQCHGEIVHHLEISLGYQHRGIEKKLLGGPDLKSLFYMENLAGDSCIAHGLSYCRMLEKLSGTKVSKRAVLLRAIMLELERLANHVGDMGALAGDVGFLPTANYCGRIRGDFLNLSLYISGSRFGRSMLTPGGVQLDLPSEKIPEFLHRLRLAFRDAKGATDLLWESVTVMDRFDSTGILTQTQARDIGLVGPAARACGLEIDTRFAFDDEKIYSFLPLAKEKSGDVAARAKVRSQEIESSYNLIETFVKMLEGLSFEKAPEQVKLAPESLCLSLTEGWRGEVFHAGVTDSEGKFSHYKVVDPSFHNWFGLALALRGQEISDFPLCNKSFNLSYCGFDL